MKLHHAITLTVCGAVLLSACSSPSSRNDDFLNSYGKADAAPIGADRSKNKDEFGACAAEDLVNFSCD